MRWYCRFLPLMPAVAFMACSSPPPQGNVGMAGNGGAAGISEAGSTGAAGTNDAGSGTTPDASTAMPDASTAMPDASTAMPDATTATPDAGASGADSGGVTPMGSDSGTQPSYAGEIPIYYGAPVPPIVKMDPACPDPTQGYTEYKDTFHVEYPYKVPLNTRFSIIGGIYNFWVFSDDSAHSPTANGISPRTEATYGALHDAVNVPNSTGNNAGIGYWTAIAPTCSWTAARTGRLSSSFTRNPPGSGRSTFSSRAASSGTVAKATERLRSPVALYPAEWRAPGSI